MIGQDRRVPPQGQLILVRRRDFLCFIDTEETDFWTSDTKISSYEI